MMAESANWEIGGIWLAALAGVALGTMFFGGLWWTVRHGIQARHPALWFVGSGLVRMSLALGGIYWVGVGVAGTDPSWQRLLACLAGFVGVRMLILRITKPHLTQPHLTQPQLREAGTKETAGASHAP